MKVLISAMFNGGKVTKIFSLQMFFTSFLMRNKKSMLSTPNDGKKLHRSPYRMSNA